MNYRKQLETELQTDLALFNEALTCIECESIRENIDERVNEINETLIRLSEIEETAKVPDLETYKKSKFFNPVIYNKMLQGVKK